MASKTILSFLIGILLCHNTVLSQLYPNVAYTIENGLPSNNVYDLYTDSYGFLWIATDKGVARYNGNKFEVFNTSNGLPDNEIFFFNEDNDKRLWLATYSGRLCYFKNDTFFSDINCPQLKTNSKSSFIRYIITEADSSVTICYNEQLRFYNIKGMHITEIYFSDNDLINENIHFVEKLRNNVYKVTFQKTILFVDSSSNVISKEKIKVEDTINNFKYYPNQGRKYFVRNYGVYHNKSRICGLSKENSQIEKLKRVYHNNNNILLATNAGLIVNQTHLLHGLQIASVTQDKNGNYWVGSNNGLFKFYKQFDACLVYSTQYQGKVVYSKLINGVLYFINSQGNLYSKDKNGQVKTLLKRPDTSKKNAYLDEPGHLITNDYKYYSIFNGVNSKIDNILNPKISNYRSVYMNNGIKAMFYKDSCLYMQNRRRIYKIDYRNIALGSEIHDSIRLVTDSVSFNRIFCAAQDNNKNIWYATTIGLYKITNNNSVFQPAFQNINFKHFDFFSGLLIGYTTENTLLICRSGNKSLLIDTVPHQNCIWDKFYQIDSSNILISTNNKYRLLHVKHQRGKLKITVTAVENAFIPLHCESIAVDKQNCYFFKNGDIFSISTSLLKAHESTPTVFFNKIFADNSIIPISENIILPFNTSRKLTISYSSIYFDGDDLIYQYAVSGKQKSEWKDIDGEINLINTGYGDYTISIRAKTSADTYSVPASFQLTILKPFWLSYWFLSVVFLLLVVLIVFSVRYRLTRAIHIKDTEHKSKIKYLKAEFKAMNALINPHFIFNTLNNVQSLINNSDKKEANEYLRVFADLIRQNMHNVSRELITLEKEIMLVKNYLYLENFRFGDKLKYTINIQEYLDLSEIMVPPLLLQPLVENAIKHGILKLKSATGEIKIEIYEVNESVHIDIYDNGVGLRQGNKNRAHLHESFALENIKSRLTYLSEIQNRKITFSITEKNNTEGLHEWTIASIIIAFD